MNDLAQKLGDGPGLISIKPVTANVTVSREGTIVLLKIGNSTIRMNYRMAMTVGQWLLSRGAEAKFLDGDNQRLLIEKR